MTYLREVSQRLRNHRMAYPMLTTAETPTTIRDSRTGYFHISYLSGLNASIPSQLHMAISQNAARSRTA